MSVRADSVPDSAMPVAAATSDSPVDGSCRAPNGPRSFYILPSLILRVQVTWTSAPLSLGNLAAHTVHVRLRQSYG